MAVVPTVRGGAQESSVSIVRDVRASKECVSDVTSVRGVTTSKSGWPLLVRGVITSKKVTDDATVRGLAASKSGTGATTVRGATTSKSILPLLVWGVCVTALKRVADDAISPRPHSFEEWRRCYYSPGCNNREGCHGCLQQTEPPANLVAQRRPTSRVARKPEATNKSDSAESVSRSPEITVLSKP